MNVVKLINRQAQVRPDAIALMRGSHIVRFRQLATAINNLATHLVAQGIAPGDRVGIAIGHIPFHMVLILALARIRAVSLPVHTLHAAATRKSIVDHFKPVTIVASREQDRVEGCSLLLADPAWLRKAADTTLPPIADDDIRDQGCYFFLSSGSTGVPKGVMRTHNDVLTQILFQASVFRADPKTRFLCAMDINVGASLMRLLRYLTAGSAVVFPEENGWESVQAILADNEPTHTFISPSHLVRWLRDLGNRRASCTAFTYVAVGGGRLSAALRERARQQITPNLFTTYGASETGLTVLQYPDDPHHEPESLGRVVPWADVEAVDTEDHPLPRGEQGRLRFRGYGFATSYYENPEATERFFRNGWFYPDDIGRVSRRGFVFVETREDDMLNVRGLKIMPGESEGVLAAHPAVAEAATFRAVNAAGEEFLVVAVVKREEIDDKALLKYCKEKLGPRAPHRIVTVRELPRDAMGKVIRGELARNLAAARKKQSVEPQE